MPKRADQKQIEDLTTQVADVAKSVGKNIASGFGRVLAIGAGAAVFGGTAAGVAAAIYSLPVVPFIIGGAVVAVVAVFALYLLIMLNY